MAMPLELEEFTPGDTRSETYRTDQWVRWSYGIQIGGYMTTNRKRLVGRSLLTVGLAFSFIDATPAPDTPNAYQILDRARHQLASQTDPGTIEYRTTIEVSESGTPESESFIAEAMSPSDIRVQGVSQEEQAAPHDATGINFKLAWEIGWNTHAGGQTESGSQDAHRKEASPDYLGIPLISPRYSFGILSAHAPASTEANAATSDLHTIASVTVAANAYKVTLLGTEPVGGFHTYHLQLKPLSNPKRFRIRELWIDTYNYQVVQLRTDGNFTSAPLTDVPWLTTFQNIAGMTFIKDETALQPLVLRHDRTFATAKILFDDIGPADESHPTLPAMDADAGYNLREP
jgi:hypothetical protein